jgi:hypothetical protein
MTGVSHLVSKTLLRILDLPLVCCKGSLAGIWHFLVDEKKRGKPMLLSPALLSGGMARGQLPAVPCTGNLTAAAGRRSGAFQDPEVTIVGLL